MEEEAPYIDVLRQITDILSGKVSRDRSFSVSKLDLFGGNDDLKAWERIEQYIATGKTSDLSAKEQVYLDLLLLIHSIDWKYGKRVTMRFLTSAPMGMNYDKAAEMYAESTEFFFSDKHSTRAALRRKMADQFDALYIAARDAASTAKDYKAAAEILDMKAKLLQLDQPDPPKMPEGTYDKRFIITSVDPRDIGLGEADRRQVSQQITQVAGDTLEAVRLRQDAGIDDLDIQKYLKDESQEEV